MKDIDRLKTNIQSEITSLRSLTGKHDNVDLKLAKMCAADPLYINYMSLDKLNNLFGSTESYETFKSAFGSCKKINEFAVSNPKLFAHVIDAEKLNRTLSK
jgi:hypothetical protein